jgi:hypothetical protein
MIDQNINTYKKNLLSIICGSIRPLKINYIRMKNILKLILLFILTVCFSCEEKGLLVNCPDCFEEEPTDTNLEVKLDIGQNKAPILVKVYEGNLEDGVLYTSTYASGTSISILVTLNKKYTLTANYYISDDCYITVDSATPRVKYDKSQCDNPCYFVYDRGIDLRLK